MCSSFIKLSTTCLSLQWPPLINFELKPLPLLTLGHLLRGAVEWGLLLCRLTMQCRYTNTHTFHCILYNTRLNFCSGCSCPLALARIVAASIPFIPAYNKHTPVLMNGRFREVVFSTFTSQDVKLLLKDLFGILSVSVSAGFELEF